MTEPLGCAGDPLRFGAISLIKIIRVEAMSFHSNALPCILYT